MLTLTQIIILAIVQGLAELLPVSSSAHVIVAEKFMRLSPDSPQCTLLLVMLHTGTMFAVIVYFWKAWRKAFFASTVLFIRFATKIIIATAITGAIGLGLQKAIEHVLATGHSGDPNFKAEVESLFNRLDLIAYALAAAGVVILTAAIMARSKRPGQGRGGITTGDSIAIGAMQGLCLPFRGFSRSGATISVGLARGLLRQRAEEFSFALAVVLTPVVVWKEAMRLVQHHTATSQAPITIHEFVPSLFGLGFSFLAGMLALVILSKLLEKGHWYLFGLYCIAASVGVYWLHLHPAFFAQHPIAV